MRMLFSFIGTFAAVLSASSAVAGDQLPPLLIASGSISDVFLPKDSTASSSSGFATVSLVPDSTTQPTPGGFAFASFGALYVATHGGISSLGFGTDSVHANATFIDPITIRSRVGGQAVRGSTVSLKFQIAGTLSGAAYIDVFGRSPSSSTLDWSVGLYDGTDLVSGLVGEYKYEIFPGSGVFGTPTVVYSGNTPGIYSFTAAAAAVVNRPLSLVATIDCASTGLGVCDATHSFHWGGIDLIDANGDVSATAVESGSQTDYARALPGFSATPEPASWAMLLTGFGAVGAMARSRRRIIV